MSIDEILDKAFQKAKPKLLKRVNENLKKKKAKEKYLRKMRNRLRGIKK